MSPAVVAESDFRTKKINAWNRPAHGTVGIGSELCRQDFIRWTDAEAGGPYYLKQGSAYITVTESRQVLRQVPAPLWLVYLVCLVDYSGGPANE